MKVYKAEISDKMDVIIPEVSSNVFVRLGDKYFLLDMFDGIAYDNVTDLFYAYERRCEKLTDDIYAKIGPDIPLEAFAKRLYATLSD